MDIMTGVGLVFGTVVIATMMLLGGDLHLFVSEHAIIIIFGGSIAATMIRFPLSAILHGLPLGAKFAFTLSRLSAHSEMSSRLSALACPNSLSVAITWRSRRVASSFSRA